MPFYAKWRPNWLFLGFRPYKKYVTQFLLFFEILQFCDHISQISFQPVSFNTKKNVHRIILNKIKKKYKYQTQ